MEQRNLNRLEYHKIIARLQNCATFAVSKEMAGSLTPGTDRDAILEKLRETTEAREILRLEPDLPMGGLRDIRNLLRKAAIGGVLEPSELMQTGDMLYALRRLKNFFRDKGEAYPVVSALAAELCSLRDLEDRIRESIDPGGEVADKASPELRRLRSRIRDLQVQVKEKMDSIMRSAEYQKFFQDPIVTKRGDRYVVPVKQEYRSRFPGVIHDQSASGATLFIEPMAVVEKNNELRRAAAEEKQEIIRILTKLSAQVNVYTDEISSSVVISGQIDFIIAKGKLSQEMDAGTVRINDDNYINIIGARHPLLQVKAVPITVQLGRDFRILVITGPNTGGKTVALKTVGLLALMVQSGLHIPVEPGSETGIFSTVFADIGDEQSIEQSLSTFSSHMTNIIGILNHVRPDTLVLFDELGAGTDPTEGAALAMAILDYLDAKRVRVIATTHYSELKAFAFNRPGIENASVEFDIKTLQPTYRLNIGQPGSSSAFEIARRLGLQEDIISAARESLSGEDIQVNELIRGLEENRKTSADDRRETERLKKEVQRLKEEYERKLADVSRKRAEIMAKVRLEADEDLRKARMEADGLLQEIKDAAAAAARGAGPHELARAQHARTRLKRLRAAEDVEHHEASGEAPEMVKKGQEVFLPRYNQQGTVITEPDANGTVGVQVGIMKLALPLAELRPVADKSKGANAGKILVEIGGPKVMAGKARDISPEIDLRGMTVDEAVEAVEKYLDDAYLAGLPKAQIIHGKGTGALRKAITDLLAKHRFVKEYRLGQYGEGGAGVTVVELK
ncbi:endonuclease MutS2 [Phosphitispora fastidiosa]|uniref:endonuclease MutS2 n=1 Tax=Phosphitispora fastidiosa TaxID=2837202 RepID=UPI001E2D87D2|nr:endonuclease MutS2 [Phosphitispora fastidiosa]MBU7007251.1 DNA mismatch repair protein MutS2 [Phosphitispora fastidiosa]